MKKELPSKERLAEMASDASNNKAATAEEIQAMAAFVIEMMEQEPFGEIVFGVELDDSEEAINQKYIDYSLDKIESLPVGTKLFASLK